MHRQAEGAIFYSHQQVMEIFKNTSTTTGLKVFVRINQEEYQNKLGIKKDEIDDKRILFHSELSQFNHTILP
jgi:hypothetical protein